MRAETLRDKGDDFLCVLLDFSKFYAMFSHEKLLVEADRLGMSKKVTRVAMTAPEFGPFAFRAPEFGPNLVLGHPIWSNI